MHYRWNSLVEILPPALRAGVEAVGARKLLELRLRVGQNAGLICLDGVRFLPVTVSADHLTSIMNLASAYSPWSAATTAYGYLTSEGGHRIGICGEAVVKDGKLAGFRRVDSLCIRVCRDVAGISAALPVGESLLILGAPGSGKTTLLRDYARRLSQSAEVCVVDERGELFPEGFSRGARMDVLSLCPKGQGMEAVLRAMSPAYIAVDEITSVDDTLTLVRCAHCGVKLLATAHAASLADFRARGVYKPLLEAGVFSRVAVMDADRHFHVEDILCGCG